MEFVEYCKTGDLEKVKSVISNVNLLYIYEGFYFACFWGHIEIARFLYEYRGVDIHMRDNHVFQLTCMKGHIEIVKWLYECEEINIHANNELAFRYACLGGHIEIAKWLFYIGGIDINVLNNYIIISIVEKWLYSLGGF